MVGDLATGLAHQVEPTRAAPLVLRQRAPAAPGKRSSRTLDAGHTARLAEGAANVERVLLLSSHLPDPQRALLEAIYREGVSPLAIARLRGGASTSRAVRREAALLVKRVTSPVFAVAVTHAGSWPPLRAGVARRCIIAGMSLRDSAGELGVSIHTVRSEVSRIRAITEAMVLGAGSGWAHTHSHATRACPQGRARMTG